VSFEQFIDVFTKAGSTGALLLGIWAFLTERIVPGTTYRRVLRERDEYRDLWADALSLAGRAATVADKALTATESGDGSRLQAQRALRARQHDER